jgi:hypothetical protein
MQKMSKIHWPSNIKLRALEAKRRGLIHENTYLAFIIQNLKALNITPDYLTLSATLKSQH